MQLEIPKGVLQQELACLHRLSSNNNTSEITKYSLLEANGTKLRITATDLNTTVVTEVDAAVETGGRLCIPSSKTFDAVKLLPDGPVKLEIDNKTGWPKIKAKQTNFKLPGIDDQLFPSLQTTPPTALVTIGSGDLRRLLERSKIAIPPEENTRFALAGLKLSFNSDGITSVSTDGHRLVVARAALKEEPLDDFESILPSAALPELLKLLVDHNGPVNISCTDNHWYFQIGHRLLISRKLAGDFPDWTLILPRQEMHTAVFPTEALALSIRRAALMAHKKGRGIVLQFQMGMLLLSPKEATDGDVSERVALASSFPDMTIGFNYQFLLDFLESVGTPRVALGVSGPTSQVLIRPDEDNDFCKYVVMPIQLTGAQTNE